MKHRFVLVVSMIAVIAGAVHAQDDASFFRVVRSGTADDVRAALRAGADLDARDRYGLTPLMYAARYNRSVEVLRLLLDAGADVNARDSDGNTALMSAAGSNENPEITQLLIDAGARVDHDGPV
ncbi:MAG: ankyrin repeat domain-containing protein [Spirochaetaceae bacterium]|nr:MAG: ankyrin repeat domain-containing protein [Spirochaetaceae bacterium]